MRALYFTYTIVGGSTDFRGGTMSRTGHGILKLQDGEAPDFSIHEPMIREALTRLGINFGIIINPSEKIQFNGSYCFREVADSELEQLHADPDVVKVGFGE